MPSGSPNAAEKFMAGIQQTRAPADTLSNATANNPSHKPAGDNPKLGGVFPASGVAKGDTEASRYTGKKMG